MSDQCQSCAMPFKFGVRGTNADGTLSADYCEHCYVKGNFVYPTATMEGTIEACIPHVVPHTFPDADTARKYMNELFPTLKRWTK